MTRLSRRHLLAGSLALAGAASVRGAPARRAERWDTVVVGAGVFGAWTAWELRRRGQGVLLVDAVGPAHARASSGGESRMTRSLYGADLVYTRMALESLDDWRWLSGRSGLPVLHPTGVLMFFPRQEPFATQSIEAHRRLGLPVEILDRPELQRRYPQANWGGIEFGLFEPHFGALMARRAVQTLVAEFLAAGGEYLTAAVEPPAVAERIDALRTRAGEALRAGNYVFACGPWLPALLPAVLGTRIFPTRQEVFFFATPPGDDRFREDRLPGWADFNGGDIYYGFPDLESRGFKIAHDSHGPRFDPDTGDRQVTAAGLASIRTYLARRFPLLAGQPLVESRVCQYENSSNGDLLIDRLPGCDNAVVVGAGSGHGFKHGPAVGRYAADLVQGELRAVEPRFSLASKGSVQDRQVH
ncbi:MAG: FAD-dependent oxidoreductase [Gammaproteobacteria bacterium]|nr:FAD-dependent oxidoreductase [Gammaproteobacteria bacterium]